MISRQSKVALARLLSVLPSDVASALIYQHLGNRFPSQFAVRLDTIIDEIEDAVDDALTELVTDVLGNSPVHRLHVSPRYQFDDEREELERWLSLDGWVLEGETLVRVVPGTEEVIEVEDRLTRLLEESQLDPGAAIRRHLEQSSEQFRREPPDYNASGTHSRLALETCVRRAAAHLAEASGVEAPEDRWGSALSFLRTVGPLTQAEERAIAGFYTLISDAAHVPLDDEDWARLARVFSLSTMYYIIRKLG